MIRVPLLRCKPLNRMSLKKLNELNAEVPARIALAQRCGGRPDISTVTIYISGKPCILVKVKCIGGICELCHKPARQQRLQPHEKFPRGRGGKLSVENSAMVCPACHRKAQLESYKKREGK